jgi:TP901 family phage tail tape measure protein
MKSIGFEILLDDAKLKVAVDALKKELSGIGGAAKDIKVGLNKADMTKLRKDLRESLAVKVNIGITDGKLKNLKDVGVQLNSGIVEAGKNMEVFLVKLREAEKLSKKIGKGMSGVGGGGVGNGWSRTGFGDPTGSRSLLSAFSGFIRGGQSYTSQVGALASGLGRLGLAYGLPIAAAASFVRGIGLAVEQIKEFGARNAELAAVLATSRDGIGDLTEQAIELGSEMAFTAAEISGAQVELAKLGFNKEEIISATESVARFAIVTGSKIPDAAEAAGAAMLSFNLEATEMERVTSVLGVGTAKTALDFEKLKVGIGTTFATAKTFGLEIEDVTALLGELSNKGLSGSVAATATRNILLNLANDGGKLRKTLAGLGIKEVKGLDGIVVALRKLDAAGIDLATTFELTDKRSVNAFNTFLRGSGDLNKLRDSLVDVSDQAKVMEKERLNSLEGATILYTSAVERLNLTLGGAGGLEGILQSVVLQAAELLNSFSDFIALDAGEAVRNEADAVIALIESLIAANDNSALRNKLIAELKLSYPEVIKNINLEKATTSELNKLLYDTLLLYDKKINISIGETEFEKAIKRENEALEKQAKLLKRSKEDDVILQRAFNPAINKAGGEASKAREEAFLGLTTGIASTGFASVEQEKYLRDILKQNPSRRGGALTGDAKTANTILQQIGFLRNTVAKDVPAFKKEDFAIPDDGQLSKVEKYLKQLEDQRDLFKSNSVQADELSKAIKSVEKQIEDRRAKGNVEDKGGKNKGGGSTAKGKEDPLAGSIDELEKIYNDLYKQIEATGIESERYTYQKKAELAKKALDEAREKVKANAALTAEEELKIFKNGIDNKVTAYNEYAKIIIKDEETLNEVIKVNKLKGDLEILQREEADLQKLSDKKLDKTNELAKKQIEIELKKKEIIEGTERVNIETREAIAEDELKRNVENAEKVIKNEEDRATYIELLYLKLSKFKLENEKKVGKELNDEQVKQLAELEKQIQERIFLLGGGGQNLTPQDANTGGQGKALSDIKNKFIDSSITLGNGILGKELTEEDYSKYQDSLKELEFARNIAVAEDKLKRTAAGTDAEKEAEYELHQLKIDNQKFLHDKKQSDADAEKQKLEEIWEKVAQGTEYVGQILGELFTYQRQEIDNSLESELETLDTIYSARLKAAEGNSVETARIEKEYEEKKKVANKKAAEERRKIAIKEAIINGALAIIKSFSVDPTGILAAVTAITTGIQIATIQKQKFKKGGFTPKGNGQVDETGSVPVGIVHNDEYVAPTKQIRKYPGLFNFLDQDRRKFASGGFTSSATSGFLGVQISEQQIMAMAEMIASRTADSVGDAAYSATYGGTKNGAKDGIIKVNRENSSRKDSFKVNTF